MDARTRVFLGTLIFSACCQAALAVRADDAADQYAVAASHYAAQRWELAAIEFRTYLDRFDQSARADEARYFLGETLIQSGHYREAAEVFGKLLERKPAPQIQRRALFRQGEALHLVGDATAAEPILRSFLQQYGDDPSAVHAICYHGACLMALHKPAAAQEKFTEALRRVSAGALAEMCQLGIAQAAEQLERWDEATRGYEKLMSAKSPTIAQQARLRLGMLQSSRGQFASAVATLKPLDELATDNPCRDDARYWLAISLQQAGHHQAALEILRPWTEQSGPRADEARYRAGVALLALGQNDEAQILLKAVRADGLWAEAALYSRIQGATSDGNDAMAERLYAEFSRRYTSSDRKSELAEMIARRLAQSGNHARAIQLLESRLGDGRRDDETDRRRRYLLALSYVAQHRYDDALRELDLALKSSDRNLKSRALQSQGTILVTLGRNREAIAPLVAGLELGGNNADANVIRSNLAVCYARTGQIGKARELDDALQKSASKTATDAARTASLMALADAAQQAGQRTWAEELWQRVTDGDGPAAMRWQAFYELGRSQLSANQATESLATCERLLQLQPESSLREQVWLLQGAAFEKLGRKNDALAAYQNVLGQSSSSALATALMRTARLEESLEQAGAAIEHYQRLAANFPRHAEADAALYQAAWLLQAAHRDADSLEAFHQINRDYPQSRYWADATYRLASAAAASKQYDAVRCLVASLAQSDTTPPDVLAHALLLDTQRAVAEGNWTQVESSAGELTQRLPHSKLAPVAEFWLAEAAYRQQRGEEANRRFENLAKRNPPRHEAWSALVPLRQGQLAAAARDWPTARKMVEHLRRDWPKCAQQQEIDYLWGRCLAADARFDEARQAYARVIGDQSQGKSETAAMAQWMTGESYMHQKRYDDAIREYLRVEAIYGYPQWQAAALLEAGKCYEALGRPAEASGLYKSILEKYAQTMFCAEARQRLRADTSARNGAYDSPITAASDQTTPTTPAAKSSTAPPDSTLRDAAVPSTLQGRTQPR